MTTLLNTPGLRYDQRRDWFLPQGVVARDLPRHPVIPRPKRDSRAAAFDELAGNTTLGVHLSEIAPGGSKRGHRHVDEATMIVVSGRGWSEMRQSDDAPLQRVDWAEGQVFAIPSNAWHQHFNEDPDRPARQLAFKNTRMLRKLFGSRDFVYANDFRFGDRYDDREDYFTSRSTDGDGVITTSVLTDLAGEDLLPRPDEGEGVARRRYRMGGHRTLDTSITEIAPGGRVRAHRPLAEEAFVVLSGEGETLLWDGGGREVAFRWGPWDLIAPPLGVWRSHRAVGGAPVRYMTFRNVMLPLALGADVGGLDTPLPDRFPELVEPRYGPEVRAQLGA